MQAEEENLLYNFEALDEADAQFNDDNLHLEAQDAGNVQPTEIVSKTIQRMMT